VANVNGMITDGPSEGFLHGPADQWVEDLSRLAVDLGFDSFVLWSKGDATEQVVRFAQVAREVRRVVAASR
jgi:hypothetical protein